MEMILTGESFVDDVDVNVNVVVVVDGSAMELPR